MVQDAGGFPGTAMEHEHGPARQRVMEALRPIPRAVGDYDFSFFRSHRIVTSPE
jgi:hypothetical protein